MADVIGSARGTGNIATGLAKPDISSTVSELEPDAAPLTVLLNRSTKTPAHNNEFNWFEEQRPTRYDAVNNGAGYNSSATALVVDNGSVFYEHALVLNTASKELFRVQEVNGNTLTVVRGIASSAAAMVDNDELLVVGIAMMEGDTSPVPRSTNPTKKTNYTQIFRTTFAATGTLMSSVQWTSPHDWDRKARAAAREHSIDQENAFWWGKPSLTTTGEHPRGTTGGFFHFVSTNTVDAGGQLTETEFFTGLRTMFRYGSNTKTAVAAALPVDVLNAYPRGKLQIQQGEMTYGLRVMRYISPHGDLNVVKSNLFEGAVYGGYIAVLDMPNFGKRYLSSEPGGSRDTHRNEHIEENDRDGRKDELLTESGYEIKLDRTHGYFYGITS